MKCVGPDGNAGVAMHSFLKLTGQEDAKRVPCYFQYHNTAFFGLARSDYKLQDGKKKNWKAPTQQDIADNRAKIRQALLTRPRPKPPAVPSPTAMQAETNVNWQNVV